MSKPRFDFEPTVPVVPLKELREKGYKIRFLHLRRFKDRLLNMWILPKDARKYVTPTGGLTAVFITTPDGHQLQGYSICNDSDNYCYNEGKYRALNRAMIGHIYTKIEDQKISKMVIKSAQDTLNLVVGLALIQEMV